MPFDYANKLSYGQRVNTIEKIEYSQRKTETAQRMVRSIGKMDCYRNESVPALYWLFPIYGHESEGSPRYSGIYFDISCLPNKQKEQKGPIEHRKR